MSEMKINVNQIRVWSKNPRYTKYDDINFQDIGKNDYKFELDNYIDIYYDNLIDSYKNLIKNKMQIVSLIDLLESLSTGYNPNIDEIIVTISPFMLKNNFFNLSNKIYYVLEGNRRIFAINILLNTKIELSNKTVINTRDLLLNEMNESYKEYIPKLKKIFKEFDENNYKIDEIQVKYLDVLTESDEKIWETLNARHFGNRKGKLNWPRGLVLYSIYKNVEEIRQTTKIKKDSDMDDELFKRMVKKIEKFTGKKISNLDLKASLLVISFINIYNKFTNSNIDITSTKEEGSENEIDSIIDKEEYKLWNEMPNSNYGSSFNISSLELSMNTIKIISESGTTESLSNIINLDIDLKKWKINHSLDEDRFNGLVIFIINLIKTGKLNTRKFDSNYSNELFSLIYDKNYSIKDRVIKRNFNKINAKNISVSFLSKNNKNWMDKIDYLDIDENEKDLINKKIEMFLSNLSPILDEIILIYFNFKKTENINNYNEYSHSLLYIWLLELITIILNKDMLILDNFPIFVLSSSLRSTCELIQLWILDYYVKDEDFTDIISSKEELKNNKLDILNKVLSLGGFKNWKTNVKEINKSKIPFINEVFNLVFSNESNKKIEDYMIKMLEDIRNNKNDKYSNEQLDELNNKLCSFLKWAIKYGNKGMRDILNSVIHTPNLIQYYTKDKTKYELLTKELNEKVNIILEFIKFII